MKIRIALPDEAARLAALINEAFIVEAFFKIGNRTSAEEIGRLMTDGGEFLVIGRQFREREVAGCLYLKCGELRAYFGMLSIDPADQGKGLGKQLIEAAEARAWDRGCRFMDIHIVNLRDRTARVLPASRVSGAGHAAIFRSRACQPAVPLHRHVESARRDCDILGVVFRAPKSCP